MHIAGGLYRELCLKPAWDGLFGSGGRAALCLAEAGATPTLHTYVEDVDMVGLDAFRDRSIELHLAPRDSAIVFAYFHALSTPHLEPPVPNCCAPLEVRGDCVLRFGLIEGDAVVHAERAVFDPQGWRDRTAFAANGSTATELALVLNERELADHAGPDLTIRKAATDIIRTGEASVVVVKRGFHGALVIDRSLAVHHVPAYQSARVFKIGTGDVFSAVFAYRWGVEGWRAEDAAQAASLAVAQYAETRRFDARELDQDRVPVGGEPRGSVLVVGGTNTLGDEYVREEAIFRLRELGIEAHSEVIPRDAPPAAVLLLADSLSVEAIEMAERFAETATPVVALQEDQNAPPLPRTGCLTISDDFTTALYQAAWAASLLP